MRTHARRGAHADVRAMVRVFTRNGARNAFLSSAELRGAQKYIFELHWKCSAELGGAPKCIFELQIAFSSSAEMHFRNAFLWSTKRARWSSVELHRRLQGTAKTAVAGDDQNSFAIDQTERGGYPPFSLWKTTSLPCFVP